MLYRCPACDKQMDREPKGRYAVSYCSKVGRTVRLVKVKTKPQGETKWDSQNK